MRNLMTWNNHQICYKMHIISIFYPFIIKLSTLSIRFSGEIYDTSALANFDIAPRLAAFRAPPAPATDGLPETAAVFTRDTGIKPGKIVFINFY